MGADTGVVVDEVGDVFHAAGGGAGELEPVEDGGGARLGVGFGAVDPEAFAGDDVEKVVAIDVGEVEGVQTEQVE